MRFDYCRVCTLQECHPVTMYTLFDPSVDRFPALWRWLYKAMAMLDLRLRSCGCLDSGLL
jgi:hypothetical protein